MKEWQIALSILLGLFIIVSGLVSRFIVSDVYSTRYELEKDKAERLQNELKTCNREIKSMTEFEISICKQLNGS